MPSGKDGMGAAYFAIIFVAAFGAGYLYFLGSLSDAHETVRLLFVSLPLLSMGLLLFVGIRYPRRLVSVLTRAITTRKVPDHHVTKPVAPPPSEAFVENQKMALSYQRDIEALAVELEREMRQTRHARPIEQAFLRAFNETVEQKKLPPPPTWRGDGGDMERMTKYLDTYRGNSPDSISDAFKFAWRDGAPLIPKSTGEGRFSVTLASYFATEQGREACVEFGNFPIRYSVRGVPANPPLPPKDFGRDEEWSEAYNALANSPLSYFMQTELPVSLGNRTEHMYVLAGSGHGKTSLIRYMVSRDMEEDCCVVVIDNQRQMIPDLARMDIPLSDISLISPSNPLALNILDFDGSRSDLMEFVIAKLMDAPLTPQQQSIFQFSMQALSEMEKPTLSTFLAMLGGEKPAPKDKIVRQFFDEQYYDKEYDVTRKSIARRLWMLLKDPTFRGMFGAVENKVNMQEELNRKLVLIDADVDVLQSNSGLYGRFFIAQILQEAQRRFRGKHKPVYLYLDEAHVYLDENVETMLESARKANIGLIIAHQYLSQLEPKTRSAILSNTSIKFVGGVSDADARHLAPELRSSPETLRDQPRLTFSAYIRGQGTYDVRVPVGYPKNVASTDLTDEMLARYAPSKEPEPLPDIPDEEIQPSSKL